MVGGRGHLILIWEEAGHPIFHFKHPPSLPRFIKLARGQLWHGQFFIDFSLNINFKLIHDQEKVKYISPIVKNPQHPILILSDP